jgi:hypothetical protein
MVQGTYSFLQTLQRYTNLQSSARFFRFLY